MTGQDLSFRIINEYMSATNHLNNANMILMGALAQHIGLEDADAALAAAKEEVDAAGYDDLECGELPFEEGSGDE